MGKPHEPVKMQIFISENAVNLAMNSLFDNGALIKGFRVKSTYVKTSIPNFEEVYGKHSDVFLSFEAVTAPVV